MRFFFSATALFLSATNLERIDKQLGSLWFFKRVRGMQQENPFS
jgi:hypothetical protein